MKLEKYALLSWKMSEDGETAVVFVGPFECAYDLSQWCWEWSRDKIEPSWTAIDMRSPSFACWSKAVSVELPVGYVPYSERVRQKKTKLEAEAKRAELEKWLRAARLYRFAWQVFVAVVGWGALLALLR